MSKRFVFTFIVVIILAFTAVSCEFSASTASISSAKLTADAASGAETKVFKPDQAFYDIVSISNAPDSTKVKAIWYKVDDDGTTTQFIEKELVGSGSPITFSATNANLWPAGKYKVELYLNDKLDRTQTFSVE